MRHIMLAIFLLLTVGETSTVYAQLAQQGTGFFINNQGDVMTARHVIAGTNYVIITYKNQTYRGTVIATSQQYDLAIINFKVRGNPEALPFDLTLEAEPSAVLGFPLADKYGDWLKKSEGFSYSDGRYRVVEATVCHGNSGGPVINQKGAVIGILQRGGMGDCTPSGVGEGALSMLKFATSYGVPVLLVSGQEVKDFDSWYETYINSVVEVLAWKQ